MRVLFYYLASIAAVREQLRKQKQSAKWQVT